MNNSIQDLLSELNVEELDNLIYEARAAEDALFENNAKPVVFISSVQVYKLIHCFACIIYCCL